MPEMYELPGYLILPIRCCWNCGWKMMLNGYEVCEKTKSEGYEGINPMGYCTLHKVTKK